jgi:STE24 endopeptidase
MADRLKGLALGAIIGGPLLAGILWFFGTAGGWAWLWAWLITSGMQVILVFVAPVLIMPWYNKFTPLAEGPLKAAIEAYARAQNFKMRGIFTIDGSRRSKKANAFFTGIGRFRRIVLFDTLLQKHTGDELVAVLAHEMGHYRLRHVAMYLAWAFLSSGVMFGLLAFFIGSSELARAFRMDRPSLYAGLVFFGFLYTPLALVLGIIANSISRRNEYAADRYAVQTCGKADAMIAALKKLSRDNLSNLTPHPFKVLLAYSHPPVLERVRALRALAEQRLAGL